MFDLLNTKLIISQADLFLSQNSIKNGTKAAIFFSNNTIIVQTANETLTNQVSSIETSKEGLVPIEVISQIKKLVESITSLIVESLVSKITNTVNNTKSYPNIMYTTDTFTVQVFNNSQTSLDNNNLQIKKGLSIIDFLQCSLKLEIYYNFTSNVLISKIDYEPKLESKASIGDTSMNYYSPVTGKPLPFETICSNGTIEYRFPIKGIEIDKEEYNKYISDGFNIYDAKSEFYSSRCKPLVNSTSGGDITIKDRYDLIYKKISFSCGDKCWFPEIDVNNYTVCKCDSFWNLSAFLENITYKALAQFNFDIVVCYKSINLVILF